MEIIRFLLMALICASCTEVRSLDRSKVFDSIESGDIQYFSIALGKGADPNMTSPSNGYLISKAAQSRDIRFLYVAVAAGADVDLYIPGESLAPILPAVFEMNCEKIKFFLDAGAKKDIYLSRDEARAITFPEYSGFSLKKIYFSQSERLAALRRENDSCWKYVDQAFSNG